MTDRPPDDSGSETDPAIAATAAQTAEDPDSKARGRPKLRAVHSGDVLGRYELLEDIGEGGMATVYRARDRELRREVAVKVLFPHLARRPEIVQRFHREARSAAGLEHPNVLRIYDVGGDGEGGDDPPYIVMELIKGRTLLQELEQRGPMLAEVAACIGALLADALAAAHQAGIIHRDIKPANVLIAPGGRLLLADFGVARLETEDSLVTKTGSVLGTPAYMSPEQANGDVATARSDLYSLGATLYQLATGALPYAGSHAKVMAAIATGALVPAVRKRGAVGSELSRAIDRLMAREAEARPQTAIEVATELRALAAAGGLGDATDELAAYFADPGAFVAARTPLVVASLVTAAQRAVAQEKLPRAMALADRAGALAPEDPAVIALIASVTSRGRASGRNRLLAAGAAGLVAVGGIAAFVATRSGSHDAVAMDAAPVALGVVADAPPGSTLDAFAAIPTSTLPDAALADASASDAPRARSDAAASPERRADAASPTDAAAAAAVPIDAPPPPPDAAEPPAMGTIIVDNDVWCDIKLDGTSIGTRSWNKVPIAVPAGRHTVHCEQSAGKWDEVVDVPPNRSVTLHHKLRATVTITIARDAVEVDGKVHARGEIITVGAGRHDFAIPGTSTKIFRDLRDSCAFRDGSVFDCLP